MLKAKAGSSANPDPIKAGAEAAGAVKAEVQNIDMAFVYSGDQYDHKALMKSVADTLPGVPLIGNTSFTGVITPEGYVTGDDGFVGVFGISGDKLNVGVAGSPKSGDARATGTKVAKDALAAAGKANSGKIEAPDYFYMVAPPGEEEYYLKGIEDVIGRVPFFGGSAADNAIAGNWVLYTNDMVTADGVAVAFFYSEEADSFANVYTGAYRESNNVGIITKVIDDRVLAEIDGEPALKKYAEWRGMDINSLKGMDLLVAAIVAPLGIKDRMGELTAIRHPMGGNDDLTMNVGNKMGENVAVIQMEASVDELIASAGETVDLLIKKLGKKPAAMHLVHCGGRRAGIDDRINEVHEAIKAAAGDIPFIVEFTFGEYGYFDDGNNTCGGLMLSFTAFA
jgi:hypothetical protein